MNRRNFFKSIGALCAAAPFIKLNNVTVESNRANCVIESDNDIIHEVAFDDYYLRNNPHSDNQFDGLTTDYQYNQNRIKHILQNCECPFNIKTVQL